MRNHRYFLAVAACPLVLMQFNLTGCPVTGVGAGTNTGGVPSQILNLPPNPAISADVTTGVAPLTVQFSSSASSDDGLIVLRRWDFDNGQSSEEISPRITFDQTGIYDVTLRITDDGNLTAVRTIRIQVTEAPIPVITVDRTAAESAPAIINFSAEQSRDPDGTIVSYRWDFNDGAREVLPVVPHTFVAAGTYRVRLTVTDNTGVSATTDQLISVGIPRPEIAFRQPPMEVNNLVLSKDSPLWVTVVYDVAPTTPRMLKAGLDRDRDACDALAVLYDAVTGEESTRLADLPDAVNAVAFSPSGLFIALGTDDGSMAIFNALTERPLNSFTSESGAVRSLAFSADENRVAIGYDSGVVQIRQRSTGAILLELSASSDPVTAVAYSADGTRVAAARENGNVTVWNPDTGGTIATLGGHAGAVNALAFNPVNSDQLVTASTDATARLWSVGTGQPLGTFSLGTPVDAVAFSPDGEQIATGSEDRAVVLWDVATFTALRTLTAHSNRVTAVAFSADGGQVASGSADRTIRVWNTETGALVRSLEPCRSTISSVAFSPDGTRLLAGVQARNDIQLDSMPPNGNDLNLTSPTALNLRDVPPGAYALWAEIRTDRTAPVRTYSNTTVNVVDSYTAEVSAFTPRIPLINDRASIVVEASSGRQIFDLGPMSEGDRVDVSLLSVPGYRPNFDADEYSVLLLDSSLEVFAWFQKRAILPSAVLFSPDLRLVAARNTPSLYAVVDTGTSLEIKFQRGFGVTKRAQRIFLDFRGARNLRVSREGPHNFGPLRAPDLDPSFTDAQNTQLRAQVTETVRMLFEPWNIEVISSDESDLPSQPYQTIYFGAFSPLLFGIADYIDPRNATLAGTGLVFTDSIAGSYPGATLQFYGTVIGLVAAHEAGHVLGLRHVQNVQDIMDGGGGDFPMNPEFLNSPLYAPEVPNGTIGTQNAPQLLEDIIGLRSSSSTLSVQYNQIRQILQSHPSHGRLPAHLGCGSE